jgi:predicted heme/steroid binding protein
MRKSLIILMVLFSVFLAIGCVGTGTNQSEAPSGSATPVITETPTIAESPNETETQEQTATPTQTVTETVEETPTAKLTSSEGVTPTEKATEMQTTKAASSLKEFTPEELAQYNGENGKIYVAYQGEVYDVSDTSYLWKNGTHHGCSAGKDITEEMDKTPHGSEILKSFPVIGTLKK